jgi:hypothetical protein
MNDAARIGLYISLLRGDAMIWASSFIEKNESILDDLPMFLTSLRSAFSDPVRSQSSGRQILEIRQSRYTTFTSYETTFRLLAQDLD